MASVDSGVETGNDSNDSSVPHENNIAAATAAAVAAATAAAAAFAVVSNITNNSNQDLLAPHKPLGLPILSICPGLTNNVDVQSTSLPSTSGPLVLHSSAEPTKVLEFRIPHMYIEDIYTGNGQLLNAQVDAGKMIVSQKNNRKMGRKKIWRRELWRDFHGHIDERKMRLAAATNNVEMMRRLLMSGVFPNNHDDQGRSPLHLASSRGYTDVVRLLLEHGADPNQRDCLGNTPLHLAAATSKIAVVTLLLKAGTDVLSSDQHGHNPLQLAQTKLKLLQSCKGSDMNRIKEEVHNVVGMLLAYLQRQKDVREQVEALSTFCSRLSLSSTSDQIQDDVRDLLANIDSLSITS